ncbi:uncharacterized protein LOC129957598 [Argiope bruennichi]|uniref:uncharacterized protein LOC129957598 n=1 Tax=Argiope bruennichi TaxID=94029 RepID=UPI0024953EAC|nr:uncharacterized protein LOC129957598 [Argiope bruennichi]
MAPAVNGIYAKSNHKQLRTICMEQCINTYEYQKILCNENEAQFRSINPDNPIFLEKVWSLLPARQFMKKCGWFFVENRMFFNDDDALIDIIEILLEYRSVQPKKSEWVEETKIVTKSDEKLRDEQLRRKAAAEREKELAEFRKEKEYKEDLAKKIHADIEADNKRRRELHKNRWSSGCR